MDRALAVSNLCSEFKRDSEGIFAVVPVLFNGIIELIKDEEEYRLELYSARKEIDSLLSQLEEAKKQTLYYEKKVKTARKLLDEEKLKRKRVEEERNYAENQLDMVRDLLLRDKNKLNDETKEKLHFLNTRPSMDHLDTITELESTGSVLSDLSYTRDEDDLLIMSSSDTRSKKRRSGSTPFIGKTKRRKSSTTKTVEVNPNERLIATTTVTVEHSGPVNARSVIETIPSNNPPRGTYNDPYEPSAPPLTESSDENDPCKTPTNSMGPSTPFSMNFINTRPHTFINRAMIKGELCNVCCKRVRFSAMGAKCKDCKAVCHVHCKDRAPIPCVPINTPTSKGNVGSIADYTPQTGLMVPSLVIHCIKEIESRGMTEVGLYRVPGSDKEVRHLKEKFLKGKGVPNLANIPDIHTVCGCLKDFLRSLREPLITQIRWADFSKATDIKDVEERRKRLHQIIDELPQPNRDTLAYVVLHLKRVAEVPDCKMPVANLAKMFGPSIVGFPKYDSLNALADANQANKIMAEIIFLPQWYWEKFLQENENKQSEGSNMQKTPSATSLLGYFSPSRSVRPMRVVKYFETP